MELRNLSLLEYLILLKPIIKLVMIILEIYLLFPFSTLVLLLTQKDMDQLFHNKLNDTYQSTFDLNRHLSASLAEPALPKCPPHALSTTATKSTVFFQKKS
jgi:hypothetical protein